MSQAAMKPAAIATRTTEDSLIKSLAPRGSEAVEVGAVTVLVGPNEAGKTETLRDILRLAANFEPDATERSSEDEPRPVVLQDLSFVPKLSVERMRAGLKEIDHDGMGSSTVLSLGPDLKAPMRRVISKDLKNILYRPVMSARTVWNSSLGELMGLRVAYVSPDDRKRLVQPTPAIGPLDGPENLLQLLHYANTDVHEQLDSAFFSTFDGMHVKLDSTEQVNLTLRLGRSFPDELPDPIENVRQYRSFQSIHEAGDGYQSFVSIVLTMLVCQGRVILLDQPEAFLQPDQARRLGRWIANNAARLSCQVFIATRSESLLAGLTDGMTSPTILRASRKEDITQFQSVSGDGAKALARFPLFASQHALRLLFCEGVVVVPEGDDQIIYETVASRFTGAENVGFLQAMGQRNVSFVKGVIRQCGLPVCAITELELFRSEKEFSELVKAATGSPPPQPWLATRERMASHVEGWFDDKSLSASANEVENIIEQVKNGTPAAPTRTRELTKDGVARNWAKLRDERLEWLPRELRLWVEELIEDLKRKGVFVSPRGRLQAWMQVGTEDRTLWLNNAMRLLHQGQCPPELKAFVGDVVSYLKATSSPTRAARIRNRT